MIWLRCLECDIVFHDASAAARHHEDHYSVVADQECIRQELADALALVQARDAAWLNDMGISA